MTHKSGEEGGELGKPGSWQGYCEDAYLIVSEKTSGKAGADSKRVWIKRKVGVPEGRAEGFQGRRISCG